MSDLKKKKKPYDKSALQQILTDPDCCPLDEKGKVLPPSNDVYKTISKLMLDRGSEISSKHVHTIINTDRNGFKKLILDSFNIKERDLTSCIDDGDFTVEVSVNNDGKGVDETSSFLSIDVNLVISEDKWMTIRPEERPYGKRLYWKLRAGWTDVIAEAIWVQHQVDCVFSFKNNNVYQSTNAAFFLTIDGFCTECSSTLRGSLVKEPAAGVDVIIRCKIDNINPKAHTKKKRRQLRGERRRKAADNMINGRKAAVTFRREEAGRLKKFGGKNPPILPTTAVLRKAKEQRITSKHKFKFTNPALNLQDKGSRGKNFGQIHFIALEKFCCVYWLKEQRQIYVSRCLKDKSAFMTIDATGGIVRRKTRHEPHIFLYQCMLVTASGSVPTFQMVSADHRALSVAHFLRLILATNAPIPRIVVTDFGWALMIAVVEIFGKCSSFQDYLQRCYDAINKKSVTLPSTYLRLDVSHLIATVSRWQCLDKDRQVRRFYLRCISKAYQISDFADLAYFIESVLCLALSTHIGYTAEKEALPSQERFQFLNNTIKGVSMKLIEQNDQNTDSLDDGEILNVTKNNDDKDNENSISGKDTERVGNAKDAKKETNANEIELSEIEKALRKREDVPDEIDNSESGWKDWINNLYKKAENEAEKSSACEASTISAYRNVKFAERLKRYLLPYVAIFSGVMRPIFLRGSTIASSASSESEFADVKRRMFPGELPMRADRFVVEHLQKLDDKINLDSNESDLGEPELTDQGPAAEVSSDAIEESFDISDDSEASMIKPKIQVSVDDRANNYDSSIDIRGEFEISKKDESSATSIGINYCSTPTKQLLSSNQVVETTDYNCKLEIQDATFDVNDCRTSKDPDIEMDQETAASKIGSDIPAVNEWVVQEEWGGHNKNKRSCDTESNQPRKRRNGRPSYLDDVPEWDFVREAKIGRLPILKNGNSENPLKVDGHSWNFTNTCAFDSIFQVVLNGLAANRTYRNCMSSSSSPIVQLAQDVMEEKKIVSRHYTKRAKALLDLKGSLYRGSVNTFTRSIKRLNAKCNAAHLAQYMFARDPSYSVEVRCPCGYHNSYNHLFVSINVDMILSNGFAATQAAIDDCMQIGGSCFQCKRETEPLETYGAHVIIDTSIITDPNYQSINETITNTPHPHLLRDIEKSIKINDKRYFLMGIVDFVDAPADDAQHYMAYVLSGVHWYKYDDLRAKPEMVNVQTRVHPHLLMYGLWSNDGFAAP